MQLPHWLILAGALLIIGGFLGLTLARKQEASLRLLRLIINRIALGPRAGAAPMLLGAIVTEL